MSDFMNDLMNDFMNISQMESTSPMRQLEKMALTILLFEKMSPKSDFSKLGYFKLPKYNFCCYV